MDGLTIKIRYNSSNYKVLEEIIQVKTISFSQKEITVWTHTQPFPRFFKFSEVLDLRVVVSEEFPMIIMDTNNLYH